METWYDKAHTENDLDLDNGHITESEHRSNAKDINLEYQEQYEEDRQYLD